MYRERKIEKLREAQDRSEGKGQPLALDDLLWISILACSRITCWALGRFSGSCSSIHLMIFWAELVMCSGILNLPLRIAWNSSLSVLPYGINLI